MSPLAAYGALFLWSFLAATLLPLGSEPALVQLVRQYDRFLLPVLVATTGNYLGAVTTYLIGRGVARVAEPKTDSRAELRAKGVMTRWGQPALLLSWVPFVGDAIVALAGAMRVPFAWFSLWVVLGKAARYAVVAWIALAAAR